MATVIFFEEHSGFKMEVADEECRTMVDSLIKTLREIRKQDKQVSMHVQPTFRNWLIHPQKKLSSIFDREQHSFVKRLITRNPVARFFDYIGDHRVIHQGDASVALTAAFRFKSGVVSIHQSVWRDSMLVAEYKNTKIQLFNFSSQQHVESDTVVFAEGNIPIELLSYDQEVVDPPFDSHGQKVYFDGRNYITPDVDEHNTTCGWKKFNRKGHRLGTYNVDLQWVAL